MASRFFPMFVLLSTCGGGLATPDYLSSRGTHYYWVGEGRFAPADIEAVEQAAVDRGLCDEGQEFAPYVMVHPDRFRCGASSPTGFCNGWIPGWVEVVGEPRFPAGKSALLHEFFHVCSGLGDDGDPRWSLANQAVTTETP